MLRLRADRHDRHDRHGRDQTREARSFPSSKGEIMFVPQNDNYIECTYVYINAIYFNILWNSGMTKRIQVESFEVSFANNAKLEREIKENNDYPSI